MPSATLLFVSFPLNHKLCLSSRVNQALDQIVLAFGHLEAQHDIYCLQKKIDLHLSPFCYVGSTYVCHPSLTFEMDLLEQRSKANFWQMQMVFSSPGLLSRSQEQYYHFLQLQKIFTASKTKP